MNDGFDLNLLYDPKEPRKPVAPTVFNRIIQDISNAQRTIEIHMYVWRNDVIGNRVGAALLEAADRGVSIRIKKDTGAIMYERIEMNRKSFFPTELSRVKKFTFQLLARTFPDTYVEDNFGFDLGIRLASHPNVELTSVHKTHTKYYLFDGSRLITGSINIEDRHAGYHDYMVAVEGNGLAQMIHSQPGRKSDLDRNRTFDFLCNAHAPDGSKSFAIKPEILRALGVVRRTLYIEMAYLGDEEVRDAVIQAANRGVKTKILFSKEANIGNDINYRTIYQIASRSSAEIYLSTQMIHSKLMLFDGDYGILGSCNLSVFSLQKAGELNIAIRDQPHFFNDLRKVISARLAESEKVEATSELRSYRPLVAALQQLHQKWNPN